MTSPIAVLDVGTSEIRVVVGEYREDQHLMVTGVGRSECGGMMKGNVTDLDKVTHSVRVALQEAEENARVELRSVLMVFSGGEIQSMVTPGTVPIRSVDRVIAEEDMEDVMNNARAVALPPERMLVHSICQHYTVDDQAGITNPLGMTGSKLGLDMLILHAVENRVSNLLRVVDACELRTLDMAFGGFCSALAVLSPQQKEGGAIVIDLGAGTTDYTVYANRTLSWAGSLRVGGNHVTNDIKVGLNIPGSQATKLKHNHGSAMLDLSVRDRAINLPSEGGFPGQECSLQDLNKIISSRMTETFELVKKNIPREILRQRFGAGVVLTGGGAYLDRVGECASRVFELPCHIGRIKGVSGADGLPDKPEFAAAMGMFRYGSRSLIRDGNRSGFGAFFRGLFGRGES